MSLTGDPYRVSQLYDEIAGEPECEYGAGKLISDVAVAVIRRLKARVAELEMEQACDQFWRGAADQATVRVEDGKPMARCEDCGRWSPTIARSGEQSVCDSCVDKAIARLTQPSRMAAEWEGNADPAPAKPTLSMPILCPKCDAVVARTDGRLVEDAEGAEQPHQPVAGGGCAFFCCCGKRWEGGPR